MTEISEGVSVEWSEVADEVLAKIESEVEGRVRVIAERFYEEVLSSVQCFLIDNAKFNIRSTLDSAERERRSQWDRAEDCERRALAAEQRARTAEAQVAMLITQMPDLKALPPTGDE